MNKHLVIALSIVWGLMFGFVVWLNWSIDQNRMTIEKEYICQSIECLEEYSENVIKYEDGSVYNPVTKKSYCEPQGTCNLDNFKEVKK